MAKKMVTILDGKALSSRILTGLKERIAREKLSPTLSIVLCGENPASVFYSKLKKKRSLEIGIQAEIYKFSEPVDEQQVIDKIHSLNSVVDGIIVQLPLPQYLNRERILAAIDPAKDVDGLTAVGLGETAQYSETSAPATPKGIVRLLEDYGISLLGREAVIINHSNIVGKPLAMMLVNRGATVTICHEFTADLSCHMKRADLLVSGVGKAGLVTGEMVKENSVVVDVGTSVIDGKTYGDVDFASVKGKVAYITPVPGGVGPMTVAMLLENVVNRASKNL